MAITETKPVKQLRELLQEPQEPFILNIYLRARGCSRKSSNSESSFRCCHGNSSQSLKRLVSRGPNKSKKRNPQALKVLRVVINQVISIKKRLRINSSDHRYGQLSISEKGRNNQQVAELDRFSSASSTAVFNSFSESQVEETSTSLQKDILFTTNTSQLLNLLNPTEKEATADRKLKQQCIEERRQLSPASVLEGIPYHGSSPIHSDKTEDSSKTEGESPSKTKVILPKKFTEACILSASLWKETKQLLFDYVKEVVETQGREGKQQCHRKQFLGSEELGKIIDEKIKLWYKQSGNESNPTKLLNLDLLNSEQDWSYYKPEKRDNGLETEETLLDLVDSEQDWNEYEPQRREIESEVGDTILEELVNDIVKNMVDFLRQLPDVKLKLASKIN